MGFFQKMFRRDWRSFEKRGDSYANSGEWGLARGEYLEALKRLEGDSESNTAAGEALNEKISGATEALLKLNLDKAERFEEAGNLQQAIKQYDFAATFAEAADKAKINSKIKSLEDKAREASPGKAAPDQVHAVLDVDREVSSDNDEIFNVLLTSLEPVQASVYEGLGEAFRRGYLALMNQDIEVAEAALRPLHEQDPDNKFIQYELGRVLLAKGDTQGAEALLRDAAEKLPDFIPVRHAWIEALWELDELAAAERVVEEAFEIDDILFENYRYAAQTCLRSGEFDNGIEIVEAGMDVHENSLELNRLLGELERANGNTQAALAAFETALGLMWQYDYKTEKLKFDHAAAFAAGELYLDTGSNLDRAAELFRALITCGHPGSKWMFLYRLGQVMEQQADLEQARELFHSSLNLLPEGAKQREQVEKKLAGLDGDEATRPG